MKKKKDDTVVRTSVIEALIVAAVCLVAFFGLVYIKLIPYIGEHISEQSRFAEKDTETENLFSDEGVIHLDEPEDATEESPSDVTTENDAVAENEENGSDTGNKNTTESDDDTESSDTEE